MVGLFSLSPFVFLFQNKMKIINQDLVLLPKFLSTSGQPYIQRVSDWLVQGWERSERYGEDEQLITSLR